MPSPVLSDFRYRALYGHELALLVLSAWAGAVVAGFATFVLTGGGVHDQATEVGSLVLLLAFLPILLTLVPGVLLQIGAAPSRDFSFHVHLSFFAGVIYCLGWIALVLLATVVSKGMSMVISAVAWCYYLAGPVALPVAAGTLAERFQPTPREA
jgi:hypothetical protein